MRSTREVNVNPSLAYDGRPEERPGSFFSQMRFLHRWHGRDGTRSVGSSKCWKFREVKGEVNLSMEMVPCAGNAGVRRGFAGEREKERKREKRGGKKRRVLPRGDLSARSPVNSPCVWYLRIYYSKGGAAQGGANQDPVP